MFNNKIATVDVHQLKELLEINPQLCVIDVRETHEWQELRIPGVVHIPKDDITSLIEKQVTDKEQAIYLHCRSGVRSLYAASALAEMGYEKVYSVNGGIMEWSMSGYPVEGLV